MLDRRKYNNENYKEKLKDAGYIYIDGEYINSYSKFKCYDVDGYIVYVCFNKIQQNKQPLKFHKSNSSVIYNIIHYLKLHPECNCEYISGEYTNSNSILTFRCKCGNTFNTTFNNVRSLIKNKCEKCTGYSKKLTYNDVKSNLFAKGYKLLVDENNYKGITLTKLLCEDSKGYKYIVTYDKVMKNGTHAFVHVGNPYSIDNINNYLKINTNGEYTCISEKYINKNALLNFRHNKCGRIFQQTWNNISKKRNQNNIGSNKTGVRCPFCDNLQLESTHALILKQVWLHEKNETIVEDKSCINPNTNHPLPTDIVNHKDKIAIEVQSWFHDFEDQKIKDKIKSDYWISKGYKFYAIDQRNYTVLEMIQIFFPYIKEIPNYIDFEYSNKLNDVYIQNLLNEGNTVTEIANKINCKSHTIYDAIRYGRISYPLDYKKAVYSPIIQFDLNGKLIREYDSIKEAIEITGLKSISSALNNGRNIYGGYYWKYK